MTRKQSTSTPPPARHLAVDRLSALTDGVFAIAITLLSLDVVVPTIRDAASGSDLIDALIDQWPSYLAYTVTFFLIGAYWINHHRMFNLLRGVNHTFLILNIFFLMAIAIIPFPNAFLAEYGRDVNLRGVAAAVYGLAMAALAVMFNLVWWYAGWNMRLFEPACHPAHVRKVLNSYVVGPVVYGLAVALTPVAPLVSIVVYLLVPIGYLFEGPIGAIEAGYVTGRS